MPKAYRTSNDRDKRGFPLYPLMLSERTWFYEQRSGVTFAHEFRDDKTGVLFRCDQIKVPWPHLCAAVDNYRRAQKKRKRKAA